MRVALVKCRSGPAPSRKERPSMSWRREAGVLAAYAALFEPSIAEVVVVEPPPTHDYGPTFLNVLRVLDIPEALGLLAPRPLTVVNAEPKGARRTAQFYDLAGAKAKFRNRSFALP